MPPLLKGLLFCLVGEGHAETGHPEIVVWSADEVPGEVAHQANMMGNANFKTPTSLPHCFGMLILDGLLVAELKLDRVVRTTMNFAKLPNGMRAPAQYTTPTENIWRKARAPDWIAQGKCAQPSPTDVIVGIQDKALKTDAHIFIEEVFDVRTTTPGVVAIDEFVVPGQSQVDVLVR